MTIVPPNYTLVEVLAKANTVYFLDLMKVLKDAYPMTAQEIQKTTFQQQEKRKF
jgi:hypothetical protein